ncbi:heavy-metal-associated domain-containing protein [uncultured Schumannella sp.]|uniref:heavy-metal-associated domain-containing protein n=1 Tax=uncultured Schumannella sp. TaxID=1195956 RepID=UPI0025D02CEE|nr:heavy-metal-associated domain-containing protein [uncultured Schumannella sp.]
MCNSTTPAGQLGLTDANHACHCGDASATREIRTHPQGAVETEYLVDGMTCSHCVASVTEELSALDGVDRVEVDLKAGGASRVTVVSTVPLAPEQVDAAITEAGYSLTPAS